MSMLKPKNSKNCNWRKRGHEVKRVKSPRNADPGDSLSELEAISAHFDSILVVVCCCCFNQYSAYENSK